MNSSTSCAAVMVSWLGTKIPCLVSLSTMTRMAVKPRDGGRCSMKSMEIEFHGQDRIGSCLRSP